MEEKWHLFWKFPEISHSDPNNIGTNEKLFENIFLLVILQSNVPGLNLVKKFLSIYFSKTIPCETNSSSS